jgi:glycosyltransferase involved in cell wall biosynthesis
MSSVSVVIPAFNRAHSVCAAIDSALAQACDFPIQVIVVDDGSSDDLSGALAAYGDRILLIRHPRNLGAAAARNTGVAHATGDLVAFLDSDDAWLPEKLATQVAAMAENGWRASCTAFHLDRADGTCIVAPSLGAGTLGVSDLAWGCFVSPGSTLMFKRSLFSEIGPLDTALGRLEDWDWLLRYARQYPLGFLQQPLARVSASIHRNAQPVLAAVDAMRAAHAPALSPEQRRHFMAALDFECAAALFRARRYLPAGLAMLKSMARAPADHRGLAVVLHNRRKSPLPAL